MDALIILIKLFCYGFFVVILSFDNVGCATDKDRCPKVPGNERFFMETYENTCYLFVDIEKPWEEARSHCWRTGGEMLIVRNVDQMNFIKRTLNSRELGWSKNGVWIGASDLRKRGWEWTTGEKLSDVGYQYWAANQPSYSFMTLSIENCACMRRSDNWRWHDYHCNMGLFNYNFVCQYAMMNHTAAGTGSHTQGGAPLLVERDERVAIIAILVTAGLLLVIMGAVIYYLFKKHERQKQHHHRTHYAPRGYATVMQDSSRPTWDHNGTTRPVSNIYLEPEEINGHHNDLPPDYEQIAKDLNNGIAAHSPAGNAANSAGNTNQMSTPQHKPPVPPARADDAEPLLYVGSAVSADNLSGSPSHVSGVTSGHSSVQTAPSATSNLTDGARQHVEDDYVEMTGDFSSPSTTRSSPKPSTSTTFVSDDYMNTDCCKGATGSSDDVRPKNSNIYASPMTISDYIMENGDSILNKPAPKDAPEMHIYTNKLDEVISNGQRPLPPVPGKYHY